MKIKLFLVLLTALFIQSQLLGQEKQAQALVTNYFNLLDEGNSEKIAMLLTEDFQASAPFSPNLLNKTAWMGLVVGFKAAFPDLKHSISYWFADDNSIAVRSVFSGTNMGALMGNPPTGNKATFSILSIFMLDGKGKIKKLDVEFDQKSMEMQLMAGINPNASKEKNIREMLAAADNGDGDKFAMFWAEKNQSYFNGILGTMEENKQRIAAFKMGFPDVKRQVEEIISSGNTITVRGKLTGTNTGMFMGMAATHKSLSLSWIGLYTLDNTGKVVTGRVESDFSQLKSQLTP